MLVYQRVYLLLLGEDEPILTVAYFFQWVGEKPPASGFLGLKVCLKSFKKRLDRHGVPPPFGRSAN